MITEVMEKAEVSGIQATPKGLRHSLVIHHQIDGQRLSAFAIHGPKTETIN